MLVLNLKRHWYAEVAEGRKTVEYRALGRYWQSRLERLKPGDRIRFRLGYYDRASDIEATVDGIDIGPCPYPGWDGDFYRIRFRLLPGPPAKAPQGSGNGPSRPVE